jgi:putative two-component system response regulator
VVEPLGDQLHFMVRGIGIAIAIAIADVFDALTSTRPYKNASTIEAAIDYLQQQKGRHFDARLVGLLLQQMPQVLAMRERWAEAC